MLTTRRASLEQVWPIQQAVLRPHGPLPGDRQPEPGCVHIAAYVDDRVVGACSIEPDPWPHPELRVLLPPTWRLRGMAVLAEYRGGVGARLLDAVVEAAGSEGAHGLWANAREAAVTLYVRGGWQVIGDPWEKPGVGPHRFVALSPLSARTSA